MKTVFLFICGLFLSAMLFAQGSILGFTIEPQAPSETDFVKVYIGLSFNSGDCPLDNKGHTTLGFRTEAYSHHCLGILTYICNTMDTFNLGNLPAGNHKFKLSLSSGAAPSPCTPGIVTDDTDSTSFIVSAVTGISKYGSDDASVLIYPNPIGREATIKINRNLSLENTAIQITDLLGRTVKDFIKPQKHEMKLSTDLLEKGIYFYQLIYKGSVLAGGKVLIE